MPTIRNNRLVDLKIDKASSSQRPVPDIMETIRPGFEFFALLKHIDRLLNVVLSVKNGECRIDGDWADLYYMAQVYWLDRFCLRSDYESDEVLKERIKEDLAFSDYVDQLTVHFSIIRQNYDRLYWVSICDLLRLDTPVVCPLLSPYRSATPLQCTQQFDRYWESSDCRMNWEKRKNILEAISNYRQGLPYEKPIQNQNGQ